MNSPRGGTPPGGDHRVPLPILLYLFRIYFVLLVYFCIYFVFFLYFFCTLILADFRIVLFPDFFCTFFINRESYLFCICSYFNLFRKIGPGRGHPFLKPGIAGPAYQASQTRSHTPWATEPHEMKSWPVEIYQRLVSGALI